MSLGCEVIESDEPDRYAGRVSTEATRPGGSKQTRTSELDATILRTGQHFLALRGLDETSAGLLADAVGTSIGPIYSRYDTMEDLAVELWRNELCSHLEQLLADLRSSSTSDLDARARLAEIMAHPDELSSALVEVLAVARRYSFLREVVADDLTRLLTSHITAMAPVPPAIALGHAHVALGALFLAPVGSKTTPEDMMTVLEFLAVSCHDRVAAAASPVKVSPTVFPLPNASSGDELLDAFTKAVLEVVAQVGYAKASANRIARRAGHGFSSVYSHYGTKDEFIETTVNLLVDQLIVLTPSGFVGTSREDFIATSVANTQGFASESNRLERHLRLEVVLAARHHEVLGSHMAAAYEGLNAFGREAFQKMFPSMADEQILAIRNMWQLIRSQGFGLSLIRSTTALAAEIEWTPAATALRNQIEQRILNELS